MGWYGSKLTPKMDSFMLNYKLLCGWKVLLFINPKRWTCCKWRAFWVQNGAPSGPRPTWHSIVVSCHFRFLSVMGSRNVSAFVSNECGRKATRAGDVRDTSFEITLFDTEIIKISASLVVFPWYPSSSPLLIGFLQRNHLCPQELPQQNLSTFEPFLFLNQLFLTFQLLNQLVCRLCSPPARWGLWDFIRAVLLLLRLRILLLLLVLLLLAVQIPVGTAGPQPHCRTSTATSRLQWALPDLNRELQIPVGTAGPQPRAPDPSGHCRTSTATSRSQWALPDLNGKNVRKDVR